MRGIPAFMNHSDIIVVFHSRDDSLEATSDLLKQQHVLIAFKYLCRVQSMSFKVKQSISLWRQLVAGFEGRSQTCTHKEIVLMEREVEGSLTLCLSLSLQQKTQHHQTHTHTHTTGLN